MKTSISSEYSSKNIVRVCIIVTLIITIIGSYKYYNYLKEPVDPNSHKGIFINIPKGSTSSKIAELLKEYGLIKSELYFKLIVKQRNIGSQFKAGNYKLSKSMNTDEIIEQLINGRVFIETVKITIPEGFELEQIVDRLTQTEGLNIDKEKFLYLVENGNFNFKFLEGIPKGGKRLEGFLFPDTYEVKKDITEEELIVMMLNRFDQIFKEEYYERAKELDMNVKEIITLASIIEREAKLDRERPIISSVFHNRLKKNKLLQSCATVQYALGERKEDLTLKDLEIDSPYNTYKHLGLPPSPIASPGKASIEAALFPEDTDYLYFVAKGDGSHIFSKTYSEHLNAKNRN
jgi:UPF0755 protein